ncbi:hypothetical protein DDE18_10575 [Nocardioides gansuensis]|uniref:Cell division protein FtsL n=1 Tax=Nocardioides gansuensis TaxID=2138300 RepID=A0A2T8FAP6_9ACTN|nr:hypothetical protein [Nocardioides gansuensis]PVG82796.1 hypothetical protein DDE18_10575 [Nocardioides gansuensis]
MSSPAVQLRNRVPRIAEAAVERARLSVVPRARNRAARVPFVTLVSLILVGGIVGLLLFNTSMQQAAFAATALEQQASDLAAREQTLQMELEELRDPQRVATQAQQMGMVVPPAPTFLSLDGEVRGMKVPATPEDGLRISPPPVPKPKVLDPAPTIVKVTAEPTPVTKDAQAGKKKGKKAQHTAEHKQRNARQKQR